MGPVLCPGAYVWILYSVHMCVGLVCVQVCNSGSDTVSRCISVDPVQYPCVCGSGMCPGV